MYRGCCSQVRRTVARQEHGATQSPCEEVRTSSLAACAAPHPCDQHVCWHAAVLPLVWFQEAAGSWRRTHCLTALAVAAFVGLLKLQCARQWLGGCMCPTRLLRALATVCHAAVVDWATAAWNPMVTTVTISRRKLAAHRPAGPVCQASHTAGNRTTQTATNTYFQALRTMVPNPSAVRKLGDRRTPTTDGVDPSVRPYAVTAVASP